MSQSKKIVELSKKNIKRILIIKWSAMGDLAIATAIFEDVHKAFPDAQIDLNTLPTWKKFFENDPRFNNLICIDVRRKGHKFKALREWLSIARKNRYDLIIDLQANDRSRFMLSILRLTFSRIRWFLGINKQYPYNIYPEKFLRNTFKRAQAGLRAGGIETPTNHPVIHYAQENADNATRLLQQYKLVPQQYAVFFPGSQAEGYLKRWGVDNYADLATLLADQGVSKTILIGAGEEADECAAIAKKNPTHIIDLCNQTKILDIVPLCADARYLVANDTGTARIAAATQTPMVMIFGPTNPERDLPGGKKVAAVQANAKELPCIKCFKKHCSHHSCMKIVTPEDIMQSLLKL